MHRTIDNYLSSLDTLKQVPDTNYLGNSILLSGCVCTFRITFKLACKVMKCILEQEGFSQSEISSPKLILETAHSRGLIRNSVTWQKMLQLSNDAACQYNRESAIALCKAIPEFIKCFDDLALELKSVY